MYTVSRTKSSQTTINVEFAFDQTNFSFNERTWKSMQDEVERYIKEIGSGNIRDPPNVPV